MSNVTRTASRVSGLMEATRNGWNWLIRGRTEDRVQWHLKWSKGSLQSRQRWRDLHGVDPNRLTISLFADPQRGQSRLGEGPPRPSASRLAAIASPGALARSVGGAMPYALSFSLASSVSQSVVQAGDNSTRSS